MTSTARAELAGQLSTLGLGAGDDVLVHCSMRRLGPVDGGPAAVAGALRDVVGPRGTVVVPAQTPNNSVSSDAYRAATRDMTAEQRRAYEDGIQGFDPARTPAYGMGVFAEHVRKLPGAVRSAHPQASFCAWGPAAADLMGVHDLDCHLGERSPLAALYARAAKVLLLGPGYEACTALHLAEYRRANPPAVRAYRCWIVDRGTRLRLDFRAAHLDAGCFPELGAGLDRQPFSRTGRVGAAPARLLPVRSAVDFAVSWMNTRTPR